MYVGRFAPSPTGPLHFGSLVAALASYMEARSAKGKWLLRMEDLDKPREQPGAADAILRALEAFGLNWDGAVEYQSRRTALYQAALDRLKAHTYPCGCTRREMADSALAIDGGRVYGGDCRGGLAAGKTARAIRIKAQGNISFVDRTQGAQAQDLERDIGTEMDVLEARDGWFRIRGYDPSPFVEGWIAGRYLEFDLQTDKVFAAPDSGAAVVATSWDTPDGHISFTWRDPSDCKGKWVNARFTGRDGIERDGWAAGVCGNQDTTCDGVYGERHEHRD